MSETISRVSLNIISKHKWPIVFVLAGLLVAVSGLVAVQDAQAQFGPLVNLADPAKTSEIHCGEAMMPPGTGTFGGNKAPCIISSKSSGSWWHHCFTTMYFRCLGWIS